MTEDKYLPIRTPRDALAVLCLRFYEKFGKAALPLIEDVCYQLGRAIGSKMREGLTDGSLINVGQAFVDAARKRGTNIQIYMKIENPAIMSIGYCATFFLSFPSSSLGTGSPKLELLHSCVPKLELGNKKQKICTQFTIFSCFVVTPRGHGGY